MIDIMFKGRRILSIEELSKFMHQDSSFFTEKIRDSSLLEQIRDIDPNKADKIRRLSFLSYPDDVLVFLSSLILNPYLSFRIGKYNFKSYKDLGMKMLISSPSIDPVLLQVVNYQLISKHMHSTGYDKENKELFDKVVDIERQTENDRELVYFLLAYLLSQKKTIIYKGAEYKDIYNLVYYLFKSGENIENLGQYLSTSPLLRAYSQFNDKDNVLSVFFHLTRTNNKEKRRLESFLSSKG